jgi:hypothetical protein
MATQWRPVAGEHQYFSFRSVIPASQFSALRVEPRIPEIERRLLARECAFEARLSLRRQPPGAGVPSNEMVATTSPALLLRFVIVDMVNSTSLHCSFAYSALACCRIGSRRQAVLRRSIHSALERDLAPLPLQLGVPVEKHLIIKPALQGDPHAGTGLPLVSGPANGVTASPTT